MPAWMPKPTIRRVHWSMTSSTQWLRKIADSHRNRSMLQRLSFVCPRKVSHEGPHESGSGWYRTARMRRTTSLSIAMPKARAICCAIRGQPQVGFRCFMSTTAAITSWVGLFGPGFFGTPDEKSRRYFRLVRARWSVKNVEGFMTIAERINRRGRMRSAHKLATMRSEGRRLGERLRERLRIRSCCLTSTDSASTERAPPGPASRATVANRCRNRTARSRMARS